MRLQSDKWLHGNGSSYAFFFLDRERHREGEGGRFADGVKGRGYDRNEKGGRQTYNKYLDCILIHH